MRIITHRNGHYIRMGCVICGTSLKMGDYAHEVYAASGEHLGVTCDECSALSDSDLLQQLRTHAEGHRAWADDLDALASEPLRRVSTEGYIDLESGTIEPVTDDDRAHAKAYDAWNAKALLADVAPERIDTPGADDEDFPF